MANTGSKIYRTLRLYKNGVRTEHVKPNDARDPNYIPPFTDIVSCYTDAPTPVPVPIPTPAPIPIPIPAPAVAPAVVPVVAPQPTAAPGVIPAPSPVVSKPPVVPTPVGGGLIAYLSGPQLNIYNLCALNYATTMKVDIASASISTALDKQVSRNGIAFDGNDKWYAAAVAKNLTTQSSEDWYAVLIDKQGFIREIALSKTICRGKFEEDYLLNDDDNNQKPKPGASGTLTNPGGQGLL
jgi:hypothetical protein